MKNTMLVVFAMAFAAMAVAQSVDQNAKIILTQGQGLMAAVRAAGFDARLYTELRKDSPDGEIVSAAELRSFHPGDEFWLPKGTVVKQVRLANLLAEESVLFGAAVAEKQVASIAKAEVLTLKSQIFGLERENQRLQAILAASSLQHAKLSALAGHKLLLPGQITQSKNLDNLAASKGYNWWSIVLSCLATALLFSAAGSLFGWWYRGKIFREIVSGLVTKEQEVAIREARVSQGENAAQYESRRINFLEGERAKLAAELKLTRKGFDELSARVDTLERENADLAAKLAVFQPPPEPLQEDPVPEQKNVVQMPRPKRPLSPASGGPRLEDMLPIVYGKK